MEIHRHGQGCGSLSFASALGTRPPFAPVRRAHLDLLARVRIDPSAPHAAAGKCQRMRTVLVQNGKLKVVIERRSVDGLPLHTKGCRAARRFSLIWIKKI